MGFIRNITDKLFPTGRAHNIGEVGGNMRDALSDGVERINQSTDSLVDGVLPDNSNFTIDWCLRHERMYGLSVLPTDTLQSRMNRILAHLAPPQLEKGMLSLQIIQDEINAAGWTGALYVHENLQGLSPQDVLPQLTFPAQMGDAQGGDGQLGGINFVDDYPQFYDFNQLGDGQGGDGQLGSDPLFNNIIGNSIIRHDDTFVNLSPLENTFYICGVNLGDVVTLPQSDEAPLRQLLLNIKPLNSVGFLLIEYI